MSKIWDTLMKLMLTLGVSSGFSEQPKAVLTPRQQALKDRKRNVDGTRKSKEQKKQEERKKWRSSPVQNAEKSAQQLTMQPGSFEAKVADLIGKMKKATVDETQIAIAQAALADAVMKYVDFKNALNSRKATGAEARAESKLRGLIGKDKLNELLAIAATDHSADLREIMGTKLFEEISFAPLQFESTDTQLNEAEAISPPLTPLEERVSNLAQSIQAAAQDDAKAEEAKTVLVQAMLEYHNFQQVNKTQLNQLKPADFEAEKKLKAMVGEEDVSISLSSQADPRELRDYLYAKSGDVLLEQMLERERNQGLQPGVPLSPGEKDAVKQAPFKANNPAVTPQGEAPMTVLEEKVGNSAQSVQAAAKDDAKAAQAETLASQNKAEAISPPLTPLEERVSNLAQSIQAAAKDDAKTAEAKLVLVRAMLEYHNFRQVKKNKNNQLKPADFEAEKKLKAMVGERDLSISFSSQADPKRLTDYLYDKRGDGLLEKMLERARNPGLQQPAEPKRSQAVTEPSKHPISSSVPKKVNYSRSL